MAQDPQHFTHELNKALDETTLKPLHWRVWTLSAMGVFLDGFDLFIIGVALPLINRQFDPDPTVMGLIGASAVLGTIIGASVGGRFTDRYGRKALYLIDLSFFILFSFLTAISWDVYSLIAFRFLLGVGIGVDYPICASYVSEFMPRNIRGRMLIGAFSFQALGMLTGAATGLLILKIHPDEGAWRWMLVAGTIPAIVVLILRTTVPESPRWLLGKGKVEKAIDVLTLIVPAKTQELRDLVSEGIEHVKEVKEQTVGYSTLLTKRYLRRTVLSIVPWFMMDIATYGVGIFTPTILAVMAFRNDGSFIAQDLASTEGAALLDIFLIVGFLLNIWLVEKWGRIKLQIVGFAGMTVGLGLLAWAGLSVGASTSHLLIILIGFMLFNLFMNMGPNATTFILPAELYPTKLRASAHGLATSGAKLGAALGIFMLPIIKDKVGVSFTLLAVAACSIVGLVVTALFKVDTKGRSLEEINPGEL